MVSSLIIIFVVIATTQSILKGKLGVVGALVVSVLLDQIFVSFLVRLPLEIGTEIGIKTNVFMFMAIPWPDYKPRGQKSEPYRAS